MKKSRRRRASIEKHGRADHIARAIHDCGLQLNYDRDQGLAKIDLPKDAKRLFRFEMVRIPIRQDDPFGSSGYGGAGGGYGADGGYGGGTPVLLEVVWAE